MRIRFVVSLLTVSLCLVWEDTLCATWQELLDRADSLVAIGNLESAGVAVDEAISTALTQYGESDTTVKVRFYREGVRESYFFQSHAEAESLYTRVLSTKEKILGSGHPDVATALMDLAGVYGWQRKYAEARPLYERALAIREEALGPDSPAVARSLSGLGGAHRRLADYDAAEPLYKRSLSILEQALDPEHPEVATSLNNLAMLYDTQGKYAEAEPLYRRALAIREQALGPEHLSVAHGLNNLAILYHNQGKYADAEPLYRRALAICEQALGPDHPYLADCLESFSRHSRLVGDMTQALELAGRALEIRKENFRGGSTLLSEKDALTYSQFMRTSAGNLLILPQKQSLNHRNLVFRLWGVGCVPWQLGASGIRYNADVPIKLLWILGAVAGEWVCLREASR
jgi:tetratricopeptide (TPR) repeat protein